MKKYILGFGSVATAIAPIAGVVACSKKDDDTEETKLDKIKKELKTVLVIGTTASAETGTTQIASIKTALKLKLKTVLDSTDKLKVTNKDKSSSTAVAITATTDATAIKYHVTILDKDDKEIGKDLEFKVRKISTAEINQEKLDKLHKAFKDTYGTTALVTTTSVSSGLNSATAYTTAELLTSIKSIAKTHATFTTALDTLVDASSSIAIKSIGGTTATTGSTDNSMNLATEKDVVLTLTFGTKVKDVTIKVKSA